MKFSKIIFTGVILSLLFISSCADSPKRPRINAAKFSPDGNYLVFSIETEKEESIYMANKDGTGLKRLTFAKGRDDSPVYSPDSSKIVFSSS